MNSGTLRARAATLAAVGCLGLPACGGSAGEQLQQDAEERARSGVEEAKKAARRKAAEQAKREIEKLERRAKREVRENAEKEIERASDRAQREVDKAARQP